MIDKYDLIFDKYKTFIGEKSQYNARVVKYNTNTSTYFPIITCILSNLISTDNSTIDKTEYYEQFFFTIDIYTKNKLEDNVTISSQVINDELAELTIQFFRDYLNMKITLCSYTPNLDTDILRRTLRFQCMIGNVRSNIIRR